MNENVFFWINCIIFLERKAKSAPVTKLKWQELNWKEETDWNWEVCVGYDLVLIKRGFPPYRTNIYKQKSRSGAWVVSLPCCHGQLRSSSVSVELQGLSSALRGRWRRCLFLALEFWTIPVFQIMLSPDARNTAWVSFDGRKRQEICHGDRSELSSDCLISKYRKSWFMQLPHSLTSAKRVFGSEGRSFYKP